MPRVYKRKFSWRKAQRLHAEGWSYNKISRELGVSAAAVRLACDPQARERQYANHDQWQRSGVCSECGATCSRKPGVTPRCARCAARAASNVRDGQALCSTCRQWLDLDRFSRAYKRIGRGVHHECKPCQTNRRREQRLKNPEYEKLKYRAHRAVRHALDMGTLVRADRCARCGEPGKIEAHHADYEKKLAVVWLCQMCHIAEHKRLRQTAA